MHRVSTTLLVAAFTLLGSQLLAQSAYKKDIPEALAKKTKVTEGVAA